MPPQTLGLAIAIPRSHGCVLECAFHRQSATDHVIHEALSHEEQCASVLEYNTLKQLRRFCREQLSWSPLHHGITYKMARRTLRPTPPGVPAVGPESTTVTVGHRCERNFLPFLDSICSRDGDDVGAAVRTGPSSSSSWRARSTFWGWSAPPPRRWPCAREVRARRV